MNLLWRVIETEEETILKDGIPRTFYAGVITHIKFELQHLEEKVVKWMGLWDTSPQLLRPLVKSPPRS